MPRCAIAILLLTLPAFAGCITRDGDLEGARAPDFELATTSGERVNLTTFEGRWLVLNLMATWCQYCRVEAAHLKELQETYGERVAILSVSVDRTETAAELDDFAREHETPWPYAPDPTGRVARDYRQTITPKTVIVDPEGVVRLEVSGQVYMHTFTRVIDPEPTAAPRSLAPIAGGAALAFLGGALVALSPYVAPHRARARSDAAWRRGAIATAAALALALVAALAAFADLAGTRAIFVSLAIAAFALGGAFYAALGRARVADAPSSALRAGGELVYQAAPALALAFGLALRGGGGLAFALPFAAALVGYSSAWLAAARWPAVAAKRVVGSLALAGAGVALALVAAMDGIPL